MCIIYKTGYQLQVGSVKRKTGEYIEYLYRYSMTLEMLERLLTIVTIV